MRYLIVAAHPDDEALGAGAMIHHITARGDEVFVCLLSHWSPTRDDNLEDGIKESHRILGVAKSYVGDFGCMRFKDADHHEIVRFIESCIRDCRPEVLITHHPADIHVDHGVAAECCLEAAKLPQRQTVSIPAIQKVMFMEVPSSTDWNISPANGVFVPNTFIEVKESDVAAKVEAIGVYKDVIRKAPHPRSSESINALSVVRGSQCGTSYAEAFQLVFGLGV
jgi:LmbE family N-acetylglucosaminyl deacetylase